MNGAAMTGASGSEPSAKTTAKVGFFTWRYLGSLVPHYLEAAHPGAGDEICLPLRKAIDRLCFGGATDADWETAIDVVRRTSGCPRTVTSLRAFRELSATQATKEAA